MDVTTCGRHPRNMSWCHGTNDLCSWASDTNSRAPSSMRVMCSAGENGWDNSVTGPTRTGVYRSRSDSNPADSPRRSTSVSIMPAPSWTTADWCAGGERTSGRMGISTSANFGDNTVETPQRVLLPTDEAEFVAIGTTHGARCSRTGPSTVGAGTITARSGSADDGQSTFPSLRRPRPVCTGSRPRCGG